VLGAVSELEGAKIIERAPRGKQQCMARGYLLGCGNNIYGYDYHLSPTSAREHGLVTIGDPWCLGVTDLDIIKTNVARTRCCEPLSASFALRRTRLTMLVLVLL
jgi:hypothetical protein